MDWKRIGGVSLVAALVLLPSCASSTPGGGGASNSPSSSSSPPGTPQSLPALKLDVLAAVGGHLDYCDPDEFPVMNGSPLENAKRRLPSIRADAAAFQAILSRLGLSPRQPFTDQALLQINDDYKQMQAISLTPRGTSGYGFTVQVVDAGSPEGSTTVIGTVSRTGQVRILTRRPGHHPMCPICLARGVLIDTPAGPVAVQDLVVGMPVWTTDRLGRRVAAVVRETGHMLAPVGHRVVRLVLADGRTVLVSPGHPTAGGRPVGSLRPGDPLDGSVVASATLVPYTGGSTFDLLPSGPTGTYFADGILLGSTLRPTSKPH